MRKRNTIRIVTLALVFTGAFLLVLSAASARKNSSRKESIDECCKKKNAAEADKKSWETLSRQFFSSI